MKKKRRLRAISRACWHQTPCCYLSRFSLSHLSGRNVWNIWRKRKLWWASAGIKNRALVFEKIKQGLDLLPEETKRTSEVYNRLRSQLDEDTAAEGPFERVESVINTIFNGNKDEFRIIQKFYSRAQELLSPNNLSEEAKKNYRSPHISTPTPSCNPLRTIHLSNEKRAPGCFRVYWGRNTTQLGGDYFINHSKDPGSLLKNQYFTWRPGCEEDLTFEGWSQWGANQGAKSISMWLFPT